MYLIGGRLPGGRIAPCLHASGTEILSAPAGIPPQRADVVGQAMGCLEGIGFPGSQEAIELGSGGDARTPAGPILLLGHERALSGASRLGIQSCFRESGEEFIRPGQAGWMRLARFQPFLGVRRKRPQIGQIPLVDRLAAHPAMDCLPQIQGSNRALPENRVTEIDGTAPQTASESEPVEATAGARGDGSSPDCLQTIGPHGFQPKAGQMDGGPMGEPFVGHPEIPIPPALGSLGAERSAPRPGYRGPAAPVNEPHRRRSKRNPRRGAAKPFRESRSAPRRGRRRPGERLALSLARAEPRGGAEGLLPRKRLCATELQR